MRRCALLLLLVVGCTGQPELPEPTPGAAPPEVRWTTVESRLHLAALASEAAAAGKGLMLDVRAQWCMPCIELEKKTFVDEDVRRWLDAKFLAARLDVTDPSPEAEALQGLVGGAAMPWVVFWPLTDPELAAFEAGKVPPTAKTISTFVSAQELLPTLEAVSPK